MCLSASGKAEIEFPLNELAESVFLSIYWCKVVGSDFSCNRTSLFLPTRMADNDFHLTLGIPGLGGLVRFLRTSVNRVV
jgi:hypothetical protein